MPLRAFRDAHPPSLHRLSDRPRLRQEDEEKP